MLIGSSRTGRHLISSVRSTRWPRYFVTATAAWQRMVSQLLIAWCLMAASVVVHACGVMLALRFLRTQKNTAGRLVPWMWLFVCLAGWIVLLHVVEITAWAAAYALMQAMPDIQSALYFSAVTYTTTGYGDLVLPSQWRLVGAVEALTGILMCGWSTGFFFEVVRRMSVVQARHEVIDAASEMRTEKTAASLK